jgi:ribose transport system substrate-binding protein
MKSLRSLMLATVSLAVAGTAMAQDRPSVELVLGIQIGFHEAIACGAKAAGEEFGADVTVQAAQNYGPQDQIPLLNSVLARMPDVIVLDPTNRTALVAPLLEVAAAGVRIIAVDTTLDDTSMLTARVGTDNVEVGRQLARALAEQLEGQAGKVVMVGSTPGISTIDERVQGFEEEIANYPDLEYLGVQYAGNEPAQATVLFSGLISANPDLIGVAAPSENPTMGTAAGIRAAGVGEDVALAGVDASEAEVAALREGLIDALVIQKPYEMGYEAVRYAVAAMNGEDVPAETGTGAVIGTRDTIDTPEVSDFLYVGSCI